MDNKNAEYVTTGTKYQKMDKKNAEYVTTGTREVGEMVKMSDTYTVT